MAALLGMGGMTCLAFESLDLGLGRWSCLSRVLTMHSRIRILLTDLSVLFRWFLDLGLESLSVV